MKKIFILLFCLTAVFVANAQVTFTWTNAALDNDYENNLNWSPDPVLATGNFFPSFSDNIVLEGTESNDNLTINADYGVNTISLRANYTGTVDCSGSDFITLASLLIQGGTFICPFTQLEISGNLNKTGGTFVKDPIGIVQFNLGSTTPRNINGAFDLSTLVINASGTPAARVMNFGTATTSTCQTLILSNHSFPNSYRGKISVTDNLTISGTNTTAVTNNTATIIFSGSGPKTITGTANPLENRLGNITFNTSGNVSISGNVTATGTWSVVNLGSYTSGTSLVTMLGGTITAGNTSTSQAFFDNLATSTGSTTVFSGSSFINLKGNLTNNGTIAQNTSLLRLTGGSQSISGAGTTTLNALEIGNGTKTIGSPVDLLDSLKISASGGILSSGGNLTIKSTNALKGRIAEIASGGAITGPVTFEVLAPGPTTGWALLGASGISGQTMNNWYGQFPMSIEGSATGVTSAGGYFESVQGWEETDANGYDTTITINTPLTPGKGFWTYLGTGLLSTSDILISLSGTPVVGNVNIPLTNSAQSGTCLIANPYASPIRWSLLRNGNLSVANEVHIYTADGPYASFVNNVGINGGSDIIPAGQGFFVDANAATNLTAQESNKVSGNTALMKTSSSSVNVGLPIRLKLNGFSADYDETVVRFHGSATSAYDLEWDARKIFQTPGYVGYPGGYSKYTTISTKGGSLDYSINSLPFALTQNAVIPVLVKVMTSGQYTITGQDMQLLPPNACVTLKDKLLNVTHNIKATPYVFTMNDTTSTARFELTVCADITTGVNENSSSLTSIDQSVLISQNASGVNVNLNFDKTTKAKISVINVLGQKIVENKIVNTQNESVFFGLEAKNQLLFITVETENNKVTKKVIH
jgi:hypothetical protein